MPGPLRRHHADIDAGRRGDQAVANVEAVPEKQRIAVDKVGLDRVLVEVALDRVRCEHHDQVGLLARRGGSKDAQALRLRLAPALGALEQPDAHVNSGIAKRQRVRVPLAAVSEHGDVAVLDDRQVGVVVVEDLNRHGRALLSSVSLLDGVTLFWCHAGWCYAIRSTGRSARSVIDRVPRPIATMPDCTSSLTPNGSSTRSNASIFSAPPVASMVTASAATSITFARNSCTISSTCDRLCTSAFTFTSNNSRETEDAGSSSTILSTLISLLSCLVTCSSGLSSTLTTMVIRDTSAYSVGPTASESMLKPRRAKSPAILARTPGLFSTSTDRVCLDMT